MAARGFTRAETERGWKTLRQKGDRLRVSREKAGLNPRSPDAPAYETARKIYQAGGISALTPIPRLDIEVMHSQRPYQLMMAECENVYRQYQRARLSKPNPGPKSSGRAAEVSTGPGHIPMPGLDGG